MIFCAMPRDPAKPRQSRYFKALHCAGCGADVQILRGNTNRAYCNECQVRSQHRQHSLRYHVQKAIKAGRLAEPTTHACVDCGKPAVCYDHRDWSKPLDVVPVCKSCNGLRGQAKNLWLGLKKCNKAS